MKTMHVSFCFHPDSVGGTEVYVESLAQYLQECGVQVVIAAPGEDDAAYMHEGLPVRRFAISGKVDDLRELYGEGDSQAASRFGKLLEEEKPDLVHLHAFTRGVSVRLMREAKLRGISALFTYHTPTVSCQRGTLMRWGVDVCDGVLDLPTCTSCTLHGLGLNKPLSAALGRVPSAVGDMLGSTGLSGDFWTALRMTELTALRHAAFRALMAEVDHIVVLCDWTRDLLLRNGIPAKKITVSRHGLNLTESREHGAGEDIPLVPESFLPSADDYRPSGVLKIAFLGRLDPTKGPDILIRAVRLLPEVSVELHLYGIVQGSAGTSYLKQLQGLAAGDDRITFLPPVSNNRITSLLRRCDILAVPSRWLETGPLVVLEAFAAGIPVIGSNLGGIAELVEHGVNGLLVEPFSVDAWKHGLRRLAKDQGLLHCLRKGVSPPRRMEAVALEMKALYEGLC